jgi:hypothetical protein
MRRLLLLAPVLMLTFAPAAEVQADNWWQNFWGSVKRDWRRNNCWPEPFVYPDRASVWAPQVMMVDAGWQRQNVLGAHHFQRNSTELNQLGMLRVHTILAQNPPQRRNIYVERAMSDDETMARVDAAQRAAVEMVPYGDLPPVLVSSAGPAFRPAEQVDLIDRKFRDTMPNPRLPDQGATSSRN